MRRFPAEKEPAPFRPAPLPPGNSPTQRHRVCLTAGRWPARFHLICLTAGRWPARFHLISLTAVRWYVRFHLVPLTAVRWPARFHLVPLTAVRWSAHLYPMGLTAGRSIGRIPVILLTIAAPQPCGYCRGFTGFTRTPFMQTIVSLFKDYFEDQFRPNADLDAGTLDHIQRLIAQNVGGIFDAMIAKTQAVHGPFSSARTATSGTLAQQKGATDVVELFEKELRTFLRDGEDQINVSFKGTSPEAIKARIRFYPNGLEPFNTADRGAWATLLTNYGEAVEANQGKLPPDFVTEYQTRSTALLEALGEQGGLKSKVGTSRKDVKLNTKPLTMQLSENARHLGILFAAEPSKSTALFDARYFERPRNEPTGVAPGRTRALAEPDLDALPATTPLTLTNVGPEPLRFARGTDGHTPPVQFLELAADTEHTLTISELPGTGPRLVVLNPSPREGKFWVEVG